MRDYDNEWKEALLVVAKALIEEHRLLHHYIINIKTPATVDEGVIASIIRSIEHNLTGYGAQVTQTSCLIPDRRTIPKAPDSCKDCKWLRNNECWHQETYYGRDFGIDCNAYEK